MLDAIRKHWPEYLMEAAALGTFMVSATVFTVLLFHPASPLWIANDLARRAVMGLAMGLTAIGIIYSPWGKQSGAHMNPALTFTFYRLRKIAGWDAFFYVAFQFMGGLGGVFLHLGARQNWFRLFNETIEGFELDAVAARQRAAFAAAGVPLPE